MATLGGKPAIRDHLREAAIVQSRLVMISFLVLFLTLILIARLAYLQINQYHKFQELADNNRVDTQPIAPVRGLIFDRNGQPLATNERAYNLEILPRKVNDMEALVASIGELIELSEEDVEQFLKLVNHRPSFERQVLRANLSESEAAKYSVHQHELPGSYLVAALQRRYPEGELMGHVLGYVGRINDRDVKRIDKQVYAGTHYIGKLGIEANYESILLGEAGSEDIETNAHGRKVRALSRILPKTGKTLYLSLDTELQRKAASMFEGVEGAAVALDPETGEVLAFVSAPGYDTNPFVNGISRANYAALRESDRSPLLNRALNGRYAPGSTIKGFMGLIGMKNGIPASETVFAPGYYRLPNSRHRYRCWKKNGHGKIDLHDAITQSCDVYFYRSAKRLGIDRLYEGMTAFGFGQKTNIDIPNEPSALMPSREWKKRVRNQPWYPGETVITGIGQGYMLATPIQLAAAAALLANRGQPVVPHFLTAVQDSVNGDLVQAEYEKPEKLTDISDAAYDEVIRAMRDVVHGPRGTARRIGKGLEYQIAGKTGTAQVKSIPQGQKYDKENTPKKYRDHALFVAFAPVDDPKIALAVIVEHGGGGSKVAAPIAKEIIDYYLVDRLGLYTREPEPEVPVNSS
ncbi:MAG: penicillin-binding protein 2 [Proteobacteria bacterium]|nr:penicillin-binding protein 2 [Pseudomonadota bacterium]